MPITNLGEVLRKWRVMKELSLREAAPMIGLNHATLFRIEEGRAMDAATMLKLWSWFMSRKSQGPDRTKE